MYDARMATLFISHAAHDKGLVEAVVDLLEGGVGVPHQSIFCSSLKGQSIKPGRDFVGSIRENLDEATCVLALISEAYYASAFCMCELGGVWLASKSFLPVLVPPIDHSGLKAVLSGLQVSKIASEDDLDELRDELVQRLGLDGYSTPRWNSKRKAFHAALPSLLEKIQFDGPVARDKFKKLQTEAQSYRNEYEAQEAKIANLNEIIADLKKAKDAKAVAEVMRQHSSSIDTFESLVAAAKKQLHPLPRPVREVLYYRSRGEAYFPKGNQDWEDVQAPLEYGQLRLNSDENGLHPKETEPKVRRAIEALDELSGWLNATLPQDFHDWYDQETDGEPPDMTLRTFWERHLQ